MAETLSREIPALAWENIHGFLGQATANMKEAKGSPDAVAGFIINLLGIPSNFLRSSSGSRPTRSDPAPRAEFPKATKAPRGRMDSDKADRIAFFMHHGLVGKAVRELEQTPLAAMTAETISQLEQLHPRRRPGLDDLNTPLPSDAPFQKVDPDRLLVAISDSCNRSAPGVSGLTSEMIRDMVSNADNLEAIRLAVEHLINGKIPAWHPVFASHLFASQKTGGGIRPIASPEHLYKICGNYLLGDPKLTNAIREKLEPIQLGFKSVGGSARVLTICQLLLEKNKDNILYALLKMDIKNAFNTLARKQLLKAYLSEKDLSLFWRLAHTVYNSENPLVFKDHTDATRVLNAQAGTRQGDFLAGIGFAIAIQGCLKDTQKRHPEIVIKAIQDDIHILGPIEVITTAARYLT